MQIPQPGDVLAEKYRLDEVLGEGGFGVVLRGTTRDTGRPVAVKILKPKSGGYEMSRAARFLREMATIAKLHSPHTLTLFDYGKTDDGVLYMVCEYVDGEDLFALMARRGRLEEHEVVWILYQVLQSLAEAHELGVLHRDIKPANIRIFEYEKDPLRVKVLDFGLAKAFEPGEHADLTGTNKAVGTPRYMALEQLTGQPLSPATDLYGVGVVAAEMLLGRESAAFQAYRPGGHLHISPADDVTEPLRVVVNRLLEHDPSIRFGAASEVLAALRPLRHRGPLPKSRALTAPAGAIEGPTQKVVRHLPEPDPPEARETARTPALLGLLLPAICILAASVVILAQKEPPTEPVERPSRALGALLKSERVTLDVGVAEEPPPPPTEPDTGLCHVERGCWFTGHETGLRTVGCGCGHQQFPAPDRQCQRLCTHDLVLARG